MDCMSSPHPSPNVLNQIAMFLSNSSLIFKKEHLFKFCICFFMMLSNFLKLESRKYRFDLTSLISFFFLMDLFLVEFDYKLVEVKKKYPLGAVCQNMLGVYVNENVIWGII